MKKYHFWLLVIILIALALRLLNLTYHSFWFDEAISVHWARQTAPRILEVGFTLVEDRLPPLYYLMLKGWTALFGFSEWSVRSLSVACGVLLVPVIASIAARLFNRRVALVTAALVALNPFLIWYSQEARMYAPAVLFSTLTVWAFLRMCEAAIRRPPSKARKRRVGVAKQHSAFSFEFSAFSFLFVFFAIAGLYTHLYTGFLLPALGLWLVISYPRVWRAWLAFAISGLIITLAFTPLAWATWRFSGEAPPGAPFTGLLQRAWWLLQSFTIWQAPLSSPLKIAIPTSTALFFIFAYLKPRHSKPQIPKPLLLVTLLLISPFVIATLLLFRNYLAFFGERYFIVMAPWLLLLAAAGADNLSRWMSQRISYIPFLFLLIVTILPLPDQWSIPAAKEAWRQSVAYLARSAAPNHGILIHPDWVRYPFQYYFQGPGQTYAAFSDVTPETALDEPMQGIISDHPVIWLVQSHLDGPDPNHLVEQWLAARYPLVTELYPPGISLKAYAPGYQLDRLPAEAIPVDFQFENGLHLIGYQADRVASATDDLFHPPSGWVHVTLYWTADRPISTDASPIVTLVGPEGIWGASLDRSTDALKLYPPSRWRSDLATNPIIRHDLDVNLNPVTPSGTYQLVVGLPGEQIQYPLAEVEIR